MEKGIMITHAGDVVYVLEISTECLAVLWIERGSLLSSNW